MLSYLLPVVVLIATATTFGSPRSINDMMEDRADLCAMYGKSHTMCLTKKGPKCGASATTECGLTAQEQLDIVAAHNTYRRKIANGEVTKLPKAANMRQLSWDAGLAEVAQRWADQCNFDHDTKAAKSMPAFTSVGQNIHLQQTTIDRPECPTQKAVDGWYNEVGYYTGTGEQFTFSMDAGHFTQVIWAESYKIGCGFARYFNATYNSKNEYPWNRLVVCNYGVSGNVEGNFMYKHGKPCSACPAGTICKDSLCA